MVTTKQFLSRLDKRIRSKDKSLNKIRVLRRLAGKKLNLRWCLKKVMQEIVLVERMQRKLMRKRF